MIVEENNPVLPQQLTQLVSPQTEPQIPVQPPPPLKPPFKWKWPIILSLIILTVVILPAGAYFLNKNLKPLTSPMVTPSPTVKLTPTPDPTANWKTYIDNESNFSFAYPPTLSIQKRRSALFSEILVFDPKVGTRSGTMFGIITYYEVFKFFLSGYISFDNLYSSPSGSIIDINNEVFGNYRLTKHENTMLDRKKGFYYTRTPLPIDAQEPGTGKGLYVKLNETLIAAIESPENKFNDLKQIIPTFKFFQSDTLNPTPSNQNFTDFSCKISGCSNQICQNASQNPITSPCIYDASFACYKTAICERLQSGKCEWKQTAELISCLKNSN